MIDDLHPCTMELIIDEYMSLLPRDAYDFMKSFVHVLNTTASSSSGGLQSYVSQLSALVVRLPYPTLQILVGCFDKSKCLLSRAISEALRLYLSAERNGNAFALSFISFLANFPATILDAKSLRENLMKALTTAPIDNNVYLSLLSRLESATLENMITTLSERWEVCERETTKEFILHQAFVGKLHFASQICTQLKDLRAVADAAVRNDLLILKIANEFTNTSQTLGEVGNIRKWLEEFSTENTPQEMREIYKFFYTDFQRICAIVEFLKKYPDIYKKIKIETLLSSSSILELLYANDIHTSLEDMRSIIETVHSCQQQIPAMKSVHDLEMEAFNYYAALSTVYDVILADYASDALEQYYSLKIQKLNAILRQIRSLDILCSLIEDFFHLVFMRWEHLRSESNSHSAEMPAYSGRAPKPGLATIDGNAPRTAMRHGFICRGNALHSVFSYLKLFVTKKLHAEEYKQSSERVQIRFQQIVNIIREALWKYSVLEKIDVAHTRDGVHHPQYLLEPEDLLQLVQKHCSTVEKGSSDDESRDRCNYASLTRRKAAKKRRRATFSGAVTTANGETLTLEQYKSRDVMASSVIAFESEKNPVAVLKARNMVGQFKDRSIIPKMLGSPQNLAIMALVIKNFSDVKYIIETFNLQNTDLNHELNFVEQQQQVKQKLATIYANYQQQELTARRNGTEPKATVEQIRNVAAKGFEVSKIISLVDNFAQTQKIKQTAELKQLLLKYSKNPQYTFLRQFEEPNLNAVIVTDLILNLPFNHEITSNVLMVIKRQQQITAGIVTNLRKDAAAGANTKITSKMPILKDAGAMTFVENLCECLRIFEQSTDPTTGKPTSLQELLSNNYYSLQPRKLLAELERERAFSAVFYKANSEYAHCEELRAHMPLFQHLNARSNYYGRFYAYVAHLAKLLHLRDPNLEYHTNELLKIDPCDIIGELIFDCDMTPLEIESNVFALNLNLVHVIALNICPEIVGKCHAKKDVRVKLLQKQQTILNYISNHNQLLAYLLQRVNDTQPTSTDPFMNSIYLNRFLQLPEIESMAILYDGKKLVAALRSDCLDIGLLRTVDSMQAQLNLLFLQLGNRESRVDSAKIIDGIILNMIEGDAKNIHLVAHMNDISLKAQLIYEHFTKIATTRVAKELIESTLQHREATTCIKPALRVQLEHTLADITVYAKVSEVLQFETWPQAYDFGLRTPNAIFQKLLQLHLYKLCYKWCQVVELTQQFKQYKRSFMSSLLDALLGLNDEQTNEMEINKYLLLILETFPVDECVEFLDEHKNRFRSVSLLRYVINFLMTNVKDVNKNYNNYTISLGIFEQLAPRERDQFWNILRFPLLIIEQLIMNAKFEVLSKVLQTVRKSLQPSSRQTYEPGSTQGVCAYCFNKQGNVYDIQPKSADYPLHKVPQQFGVATSAATSTNSAFILLSYNLYQKDHVIRNECVDLLLRIYATKALDYHISYSNSSSEYISQTTDMQNSLDSLCGAFQLPKVAPARDEWVRDDEATHCMCCRRAVFTIVCRRHHCRRCGRVVCFGCSTHRMRIPELYDEVEVRICNDCQRTNQEETLRKTKHTPAGEQEVDVGPQHSREHEMFKWKLSGNITHDKLVREEFCYEHAPSVALCLSILGFHLDEKKCVELLLHHCRKLEKLIVPNPEVDYELVAKMMNCLALAAKVRHGPPEIETIREHSEIIMSVVQNGCESLLPPGPLNNYNLRKLGDALVQAEKWQLAFELHLKCGFSTAGVMAAYGFASLKAGCFETAREKFSHCMPKLSNELLNFQIFTCIVTKVPSSNNCDSFESTNNWLRENEIAQIKRPQRGPPLLHEILKTIDSMSLSRPNPETLRRASIIRNSNTSLASLLSRRKDHYVIPMHEPAINVLNILDNLKRITKGQYSEGGVDLTQQNLRQTRSFEEGMHYVLSYGSHADILQFLMRYHELCAALQYFLVQNLEADLFIHNIYLVCLRCGNVSALITEMLSIDARLIMWHSVLLLTCRYLEKENLLNSLYQLQLLLKDPVRASMTCVKFYSMNCENFQQLHANAQHLQNAHQHLQSELEISQWENINIEPVRKRQGSLSSRRVSTASAQSHKLEATFLMQMDAAALNSHINTILKQMDVAKFLCKCEKENSPGPAGDGLITEKILKQIRGEAAKSTLPTLFDTAQDKIQVCILLLYCGKNIEEGFGLAYRIIQDYKLSATRVFNATAKYLARNQRLAEVEKLINCITSNNGSTSAEIDEIISIAINSATSNHEPEVKAALDALAKKIHSVELRISSHIFIGQLKSAYLLANKYERLADIRKILRQAEITNQIHIKRLCEKKLAMSQSALD